MKFRFSTLLLLAFGFLCAPGTCEGQQLPRGFEASMNLTGTVNIEPDGSISSYSLNDEAHIPSYVRKALEQKIDSWKFEPTVINGEPVPVRSPMSVRMVLRNLDNEKVTVTVEDARFGKIASANSALTQAYLSPPSYPEEALRVGAQGDVYLFLKIGATGTVEDVAISHVNLRTQVEKRAIEVFRNAFAEAAVKSAWSMRYDVSLDEPLPHTGYWVLPISTSFDLTDTDAKPVTHPIWKPYLPGPRRELPTWVPEELRGYYGGSTPHRAATVDDEPSLIHPASPPEELFWGASRLLDSDPNLAGRPSLAEESDKPTIESSRNKPARCDPYRHSETTSTLQCGNIVITAMPVRSPDQKLIIYLKVENNGIAWTTLDHSNFKAMADSKPLHQNVDTSIQFPIDKQTDSADTKKVVKGVIGGALVLATTAFQLRNGDFFDFDINTESIIASSVEEIGTDAFREAIPKTEDPSVNIGYLSNWEIPPSTTRQGILILDNPLQLTEITLSVDTGQFTGSMALQPISPE